MWSAGASGVSSTRQADDAAEKLAESDGLPQPPAVAGMYRRQDGGGVNSPPHTLARAPPSSPAQAIAPSAQALSMPPSVVTSSAPSLSHYYSGVAGGARGSGVGAAVWHGPPHTDRERAAQPPSPTPPASPEPPAAHFRATVAAGIPDVSETETSLPSVAPTPRATTPLMAHSAAPSRGTAAATASASVSAAPSTAWPLDAEEQISRALTTRTQYVVDVAPAVPQPALTSYYPVVGGGGGRQVSPAASRPARSYVVAVGGGPCDDLPQPPSGRLGLELGVAGAPANASAATMPNASAATMPMAAAPAKAPSAESVAEPPAAPTPTATPAKKNTLDAGSAPAAAPHSAVAPVISSSTTLRGVTAPQAVAAATTSAAAPAGAATKAGPTATSTTRLPVSASPFPALPPTKTVGDASPPLTAATTAAATGLGGSFDAPAAAAAAAATTVEPIRLPSVPLPAAGPPSPVPHVTIDPGMVVPAFPPAPASALALAPAPPLPLPLPLPLPMSVPVPPAPGVVDVDAAAAAAAAAAATAGAAPAKALSPAELAHVDAIIQQTIGHGLSADCLMALSRVDRGGGGGAAATGHTTPGRHSRHISPPPRLVSPSPEHGAGGLDRERDIPAPPPLPEPVPPLPLPRETRHTSPARVAARIADAAVPVAPRSPSPPIGIQRLLVQPTPPPAPLPLRLPSPTAQAYAPQAVTTSPLRNRSVGAALATDRLDLGASLLAEAVRVEAQMLARGAAQVVVGGGDARLSPPALSLTQVPPRGIAPGAAGRRSRSAGAAIVPSGVSPRLALSGLGHASTPRGPPAASSRPHTPRAAKAAPTPTTPRGTVASRARERDAQKRKAEVAKAARKTSGCKPSTKGAAGAAGDKRGGGGGEGAAPAPPPIIPHTARSYQVEKQKLLAKHQGELAAAQQRHDEDMGRLDGELKQQVADLRAQQRQLEDRLRDAAAEHDAAVDVIRRDCEARLAEAERAHADAVVTLTDNHEVATARALAENASLKMELGTVRATARAADVKIEQLETVREEDKMHVLETLANWKKYYEGIIAEKDEEIAALKGGGVREEPAQAPAGAAEASHERLRADFATALAEAQGRELGVRQELEAMRTQCAVLGEQKHRLELRETDLRTQLDLLRQANDAALSPSLDPVLVQAAAAAAAGVGLTPPPTAPAPLDIAAAEASAAAAVAAAAAAPAPVPSVSDLLKKYSTAPVAPHIAATATADDLLRAAREVYLGGGAGSCVGAPAAMAVEASPLQLREDAVRLGAQAAHVSPVRMRDTATTAVAAAVVPPATPPTAVAAAAPSSRPTDAAGDVAARAEAHLARIRQQLASLTDSSPSQVGRPLTAGASADVPRAMFVTRRDASPEAQRAAAGEVSSKSFSPPTASLTMEAWK